eukprot:1433493-Rhodomonas_salina.5
MSGTDIGRYCVQWHMVLWLDYAMPGTEIAYGATAGGYLDSVWCYGCAVLREGMAGVCSAERRGAARLCPPGTWNVSTA